MDTSVAVVGGDVASQQEQLAYPVVSEALTLSVPAGVVVLAAVVAAAVLFDFAAVRAAAADVDAACPLLDAKLKAHASQQRPSRGD